MQPPAWSEALATVGVTGTNGKTSTTRWVAACLARAARPVQQTTTLGSFLDDEPFPAEKSWAGFLATMRAGYDRGARFAAIELTSEALARGFARAWPCRVGVFTNLTHDHLDAHGTPEHYLASKAQLFVHLPPTGTAVLNGCDPTASLLAEVIPKGVQVLRYGVVGRGSPVGPLDLEAVEVTPTWRGTRLSLQARGPFATLPATLHIRAIGSIYAENVLAALAGAVAAGVSPLDAASALASAPVPRGRFEVIAERPYVVVDYAHTPDALARTLGTARALCPRGQGRLTVVFGAGGNRDANKRGPMGTAASMADRVILTSDNPRSESPAAIADAIRAGIVGDARVDMELDRALAIARALSDARADDVVVIAGKGHEAEQVIGDEVRRFSDADVARRVLEATVE